MWFSETLRTAATAGVKRSVYSSWKLESSVTKMSSSRLRSAKEMSGLPMFPARCARSPASSRILWTSVVVVDLPFEPVMPTMRPRRKR